MKDLLSPSGKQQLLFVLFGLMVVASLFNGVYLPFGELHVRPEHVAAPLMFLMLVLTQFVRRAAPIRFDYFFALAAGWVVVNAISSWLFAPQPAESFIHVLRFSFLVAAFLAIANLSLPRGADDWARLFRIWLTVALLSFVYGIVAWLLARYFSIWLLGTTPGHDQVEISIRGTQFERNLFGIAAATVLAVAAYALAVQRSVFRTPLASTRFLFSACLISGIAVVLSLTRSAWIALVLVSPVTFGFAYLLNRRQATTDPGLRKLALGLPLFLGGLILFVSLLPSPRPSTTDRAAANATSSPRVDRAPGGTEIVEDRLSSFKSLQSDVTVQGRVQDAKWALDDWRRSPILGRGTGSFVQIHGTRLGSEAWISNLVLHTLLDTGLVGLMVQFSLFGLVALQAWRAATKQTDLAFQIGLKAMVVGLVVMALAYQATDGTWLAVFWVHLGLMVNGIYAARSAANDPNLKVAGAPDS